jgi:predicted Zn-dependent peptidase
VESDALHVSLREEPDEGPSQPRGTTWRRKRRKIQCRELLSQPPPADGQAGHPYYGNVMESHEDIQAAKLDDVKRFFRQYYAPNNASLAIVGDFETAEAKTLVEKYFGTLKRGEPVPAISIETPKITEERRKVVTAQVELPRVTMAWVTSPVFKPGDHEADSAANILGGGRSSRLYKKLVYELQIAQSVSALQHSLILGSIFQIEATARPGHTAQELEKAIDRELAAFRARPPEMREVERARNTIETSIVGGLDEALGGFGGVAETIESALQEARVRAADCDMNLREEKGYTYGAFSQFTFRRAAGPFQVGAGVRTDVTTPAVEEIFKELRGMVERPLEGDELSRAKDSLARSLPGAFEGSANAVASFANVFVHDLGLDYYANYAAEVQAVTSAQTLEMSKKYPVPGTMIVVAVGDRKSIEPGLRTLGLGVIEIKDAEGRVSRWAQPRGARVDDVQPMPVLVSVRGMGTASMDESPRLPGPRMGSRLPGWLVHGSSTHTTSCVRTPRKTTSLWENRSHSACV